MTEEQLSHPILDPLPIGIFCGNKFPENVGFLSFPLNACCSIVSSCELERHARMPPIVFPAEGP